MSITNKLTYLEDTKTQIKEAIKAKGVEVSDSDTFRSYASKIGDIQTGGSGDCVAGVCFDDIGYTTTPQYMVDGVAYAKQIKDTWDANRTQAVYSNDSKLTYFPQVDTSNITYFKFDNCYALQNIPSLNVTSKLSSLYQSFQYCASLAQIEDINTWDVSNVTTMYHSFYNCYCIISLDLSGWDTGNVTNIESAFANCNHLTYLNLTGWDMSKVTQAKELFKGCSKLPEIIGIENLNLSATSVLTGLFSNCDSLTSLDLSGWDMSNLTEMGNLFYQCNRLKSVNLSGWDTSNVKNMSQCLYARVLEKVDGFLDLTTCNYNVSDYYFMGYTNQTNLRKITFKNIGYQSGKTGISFKYINNWGVDTDTITDARQSLIDSLIAYSFDRATAGYSTHTISLSNNTKAVLTEEEIAQITAKGYTIA